MSLPRFQKNCRLTKVRRRAVWVSIPFLSYLQQQEEIKTMLQILWQNMHSATRLLSFIHSFIHSFTRFRSSRLEGFCKKGVLKNFTKFTGKLLCLSLFFNKVADLR